MQLNQPPKLQNFGTKPLSFEEAKQLLLNVPTHRRTQGGVSGVKTPPLKNDVQAYIHGNK